MQCEFFLVRKMLRKTGCDFVSLGLNRRHGTLIDRKSPGLEVLLQGDPSSKLGKKIGKKHGRETDNKTGGRGEDADDGADPFVPRQGENSAAEQSQNKKGTDQKRGDACAWRIKPCGDKSEPGGCDEQGKNQKEFSESSRPWMGNVHYSPMRVWDSLKGAQMRARDMQVLFDGLRFMEGFLSADFADFHRFGVSKILPDHLRESAPSVDRG